MVYTATLGYALITCGIYTYEAVKHSDEEFSEYSAYPEYVGLMLAGKEATSQHQAHILRVQRVPRVCGPDVGW